MKVHGFKGLTKPNMIEELFKGGLKKGEFINLFSYTGKGTSYIDITHPDIEKDIQIKKLISKGDDT